MAATAAETLRERDLLSRLAAGTCGVVGAAFLRRLVRELGAALDVEVAFVAELVDHQPGWARVVASACAPGIVYGEGSEFALAGTPCADARPGLTPHTSPRKPSRRRFRTVSPP